MKKTLSTATTVSPAAGTLSQSLEDAEAEAVRQILGMESPRSRRSTLTTSPRSRRNSPLSTPTRKEMHNRAQQIEEIKAKCLARRAEKQQLAATSPRTSHSPTPQTSLEIVLYGIHEATSDKNIRIITDDSISVVTTLLDQLAPLDRTGPNITGIDLQKNKIGGLGAKQLCKCFLVRPKLEKLDISNNTSLFSQIASTDKGQRSSSGLIGAEGWDGAEAFKELLTRHPSISKLAISDCGLTEFGANLIATGLRENKSLIFLDLGFNHFGDQGALNICRALKKHPTLSQLLIDGNKLTDKSGEALLQLITTNTRITILEMNDNEGISSKITDAIKEQVQKNRAGQEQQDDNEAAVQPLKY
jgi:hypothetical protein